MIERSAAEYAALRATIRERGTARVYTFALGLAVWSALTVAALVLAAPPVTTLLSLLLLATTFEAIYGLHTGVERIGRYLLVFHQDQWEQAAGAFGQQPGAPQTDPLYTVLFLMAIIANLLPLLTTTPIVQELVIVGAGHVLFGARVLRARSTASRQRTLDTERFRQLRQELS
jgi:F0F1-type ATP synthase membrane subunit a